MKGNKDTKKYWGTPKSKSVGLFTDLNLYYDALKLCNNLGVINLNVLEREISTRLIGLRFFEKMKKRSFKDLIRELTEFGFIFPKNENAKIDEGFYEISDVGKDVIKLFETNRRQYLRFLAKRMNDIYTIPGWFVARLWEINESGQGQVVIPSPSKEWNPNSYKRDDCSWNEDLEGQIIFSYKKVNSLIEGSFPVDIECWLYEVRNEYERLGSVQGRNIELTDKGNKTKIKNRELFSPRRRLSIAMRTAAINLLFDCSYNDVKDFEQNQPILKERTFMAWCPRLESLEMIYYSDYYNNLPGRLLFPLTVYKRSNSNHEFEENANIKTPDERSIFYYQPSWESVKTRFQRTLFEVYQEIHNIERILYVPLQDVRDEVCRKLRISALLFDSFLEQAFKSSLMRETSFTIALETDIREDQRSGYQMLRKPVYIQMIPHSLIAIKPA